MDPDEISDKIARLEQNHDVEQFRLYDWRVWPAMRVNIYWFATLASWDPTFDRRLFARLKRKATQWLGRLRSRLSAKPQPPAPSGPGLDPCAARCDAVMITYSTRIQLLGDAFYHYMADPAMEGLARRGKSCVVWEFGKPEFPRFHEHAYCQQRLDAEKGALARSSAYAALPGKPAWFDDLARDIRSLFGLEPTWDKIGAYIRDTHLNSLVLEKWLRACGLPAVITDNWYDPISMGALLAAHRLGLPKVEIQHGQMYRGNLCYLRWTKAPREGYEAFPAHYWLWGTDDCAAMLESNPGIVTREQLIGGGSLWLNQWRARQADPAFAKEIEQARALRRSSARTILFTVDGHDLNGLGDWLKGAPRDWNCLVRLHRRHRPQIKDYEEKMRALGIPGINVREATTLPLYAVLKAADCHVTSFSTCALEAMAFGVPTVILNPLGVTNYRGYVDQGFMFPASDSHELIELIARLGPMSGDKWAAAAQKAFAAPEESERALDWLAAICPPGAKAG